MFWVGKGTFPCFLVVSWCVCIYTYIYICIYMSSLHGQVIYLVCIYVRVVGFFVEARPARGVKQTRAGYTVHAHQAGFNRTAVFGSSEQLRFPSFSETWKTRTRKERKMGGTGRGEERKPVRTGRGEERRAADVPGLEEVVHRDLARALVALPERASKSASFFGGRSLGLLLRCLFWSAAHLNSTIANSIVAQCRRLLS